MRLETFRFRGNTAEECASVGQSVSVFFAQDVADVQLYTLSLYAAIQDARSLLGRWTYQRTGVNTPNSRWIASAWHPGADRYVVEVECANRNTIYAGEIGLALGRPLNDAGVFKVIDPP